MATFLERYLAGEWEQVWDGLVAAGAQVRQEPLYSDAWAVARETMSRARSNVELLVERLDHLGFQFEEESFRQPQPDTSRRIAEFEREVGPIPLSLRAWFEVVGEVNFMGTYPGLSYYAPPFTTGFSDLVKLAETKDFQENARKHGIPTIDPILLGFLKDKMGKEQQKASQQMANDMDSKDIVIADPLVVMDQLSVEWYRAWQEDQQETDCPEETSFLLPIAPDIDHKSNFSGSGGYNIALPNPAADALLLNENHHTTFVGYLRLSFAWGGFPGLENQSNRNEDLLAALKEGLLPI
jgi:hypothetical protein